MQKNLDNRRQGPPLNYLSCAAGILINHCRALAKAAGRTSWRMSVHSTYSWATIWLIRFWRETRFPEEHTASPGCWRSAAIPAPKSAKPVRRKAIVLQLGALDLTSPAGKMMLTILAAVAELERDLLVERTQAGLARAKQKGKILGRPATTTAEQRADILTRHRAGPSISDLSRLHGVSRATIMRIARPEGALV